MRIEQIQRYARYARTYLAHGTPGKWSNLLRLERKLRRNDPDLTGLHPYFLFADISNCCNLNCPLCQMGTGKTIKRKNRMDIESYGRLIDPLADYLFQVFLYNWGEPFLNKDIYDIIEYNTLKNIGTTISSNLNSPVDAQRLVESGLELLIVSGDGVTQDVYEKYRVGGKVDKVLENVKAIRDAKKALKSKTPHIEWQCLVTKHTEKHLGTIRKTAKKAGANAVRLANLNFYSFGDDPDMKKEWLPTIPSYRKIAEAGHSPKVNGTRKPCFWLWRTAIVNPDGGVMPCCLYDIPDWGNALDGDFLSIWNGPAYREARERSLPGKNPSDWIVCDSCEADFIWK